MPFARPTLTTLKQQVAQDISSSVSGADPLLRFSNLGIIGKVLANLINLVYGYLDWIAQQAVPFTAVDEFLEGWAGLKGVTRLPAVAATGTVTWTGAVVGRDMPSGTLVTRGDGTQYTTTADAVVNGSGVVTAPIAAVVPAAASTLTVGNVMTLGSAIDGIPASGTVASTVLPGADVETDDSLRSRMLEVYSAPPQGGSVTDYVEWALEVAGVTRAWAAPNLAGIGSVTVFMMLDVSESIHGGFPQGSNGVATLETRGTPATGDQLAVANFIYPLRPVTALVYANAPTANTVNITLAGTSGWSTATKSAVTTAVTDVFLEFGSPGGVYVPAGGLPAGQIDLSDITGAIDAVAGTEGYLMTSPTTNITSSTGALPVLGTITFGA